MIRKMLGFGAVLLMIVAATTTYGFLKFRWSPASKEPVKTVFYEVPPHQSPWVTAKELEKVGAISNARYFYWYGRLTSKNKKFKAGDYRFTTKMTPGEVMNIVTSGISYGIPLTVPEGYTFAQISEILEEIRPGAGARFFKLCSDRKFIATLGFNPQPATLEGYLFPETYLISRRMPEEEIIRGMVRKYKEVYTPELAKRALEIGMTEHQVVTLASIIEKETGAKEERPLISSIFHNRLKKGMKLQTDPTVIYGIKDYKGNITRKDLETPSPYNTYLIKGLPPGPISNPGKEAIRAALFPAESKYLYFVSHNDGTHEFTETYEDHRKAVGKFQLDPKAREGKSWRDLKPSGAAGTQSHGG